ncbi:MAG: fibronectin type III domain-containing protein [Candidatus Nanopelagicales bacterium]
MVAVAAGCLLVAPLATAPQLGMSAMPSAEAAPSFGFALPVPWGVTVKANGPHGWSDGNAGVRSGVDFVPANGTALTVTAAGAGVAHVESSCVVRIDHADGWQTKYLHLRNIDTSINGQQVAVGRRLGDAGSPAQTCGVGTGVHVHFALFRNGAEQPIGGTSIGGYTVHEGAGYYCGWWSRDADSANLGYNDCVTGYATLALPNNQSTGGGQLDQDGDGVPDGTDRCPSQPGPAAVQGCPDSDGDLRADMDDLCPLTYGTANQGCLQPFSAGPTGRDLNGDRRTDLLAFYNSSASETALWAWYGQANGTLAQERQVWHTPTGWDATRLLPVGVGDVTGDGFADVVAMYRYDPDFIKVWLWPGRADGGVDTPRVLWDAQKWWSGDRTVPIGLADINGDRRVDVLAYYRYDAGITRMWAWLNNGAGGLSAPTVVWEVPSGWDAARVIPAGLGDVNSDGHPDVLAYYRYDNGQLALWLWPGTASGSFPAAHQAWQTSSGWDGNRVRPVGVGDFNRDGRADVLAFYRYDPDWVNLWRWPGKADGTTGVGEVVWHVDKWWDGQRNTPIGIADLSGDRVPDVQAFYRYDGGQAKIWSWHGDGTGGVSSPVEAWSTPSGWDVSRIVPVGFASALQVPTSPRAVSAIAGSGAATVTWQAPSDSGGSPVTSFVVTASPGGRTCYTAALQCPVRGLVNGTPYTFTVRALNVAGSSPASAASARVVPATPPSQVRTPRLTKTSRTMVRVTWLAPSTNGGRAITTYQVQWRRSGTARWSPWVATGLSRSKVLKNMVPGRSYKVRVRAVNALGAGAPILLRVPGRR